MACPTPDWMQKWIGEEPELVSDEEETETKDTITSEKPLTIEEMFAEFDIKNRYRYV